MNIYDTNIKTQSCSCADWLEIRRHYTLNDPRRLCKHLIHNLDINNLPSELQYFKEKIEHYKEYEKGFTKYINKIIYVQEADCKVLCQNGDWYNVCDNNGINYGFNISYEFNTIYFWARKSKPINYEKIEDTFTDLIRNHDEEFLEAIELSEDEEIFIKNLVENQGYKDISFEISLEFMRIPNQLIYEIRYFDKEDIDNTNEYLGSFIEVSNQNIKFSNMFGGFHTDEIFQRDQIKINEARKKRIIDRERKLKVQRKEDRLLKENEESYNNTFSIYELLKKNSYIKLTGKEVLKKIKDNYFNNYKINEEIEKYCIYLYDKFRFYDEYFLELIKVLYGDIELLKKRKSNNENKINLKIFFKKPLEEKLPKVLNTDKKYLSSKEVLEIFDAPFSIITFNKILKQLKFIDKIEYSENIFSSYILINDGLKYGDNILKENNFSYIFLDGLIPFSWVKYDSENEEYIKQNEFIIYNEQKCIPHCLIMWKVEKVLELYRIIFTIFYNEKQDYKMKQQIKREENKNIINREKTDLQIERETWLRHVRCPNCGEEINIHKKDKRKRSFGFIQRFYCNNCKSMFQIEVEKLEKLILEYEESINNEKFNNQMKIFKYMSTKAYNKTGEINLLEKIFENKTLRFSSPLLFNDPFEFRFPVEYLNVSESEDLNELINSSIFNQNTLHYSSLDYILKDIGVLCLSANYDDILMWSHYADNHKGIVLELDVNHDFFKNEDKKNILFPLTKVSYQNERRIFKNFEECIESGEIYLRKHKSWEYEEEYRISILFDELDNEDKYNVKFPENLIKSVFIGVRTSQEDIEYILNLKSKIEWEHLNIYRLKMNEKSYEFEAFEARFKN